MSSVDSENAKAVELSMASDAFGAISRMLSAPAFLSEEDWRALESIREPILVGNAKGVLPENLVADDDDR